MAQQLDWIATNSALPPVFDTEGATYPWLESARVAVVYFGKLEVATYCIDKDDDVPPRWVDTGPDSFTLLDSGVTHWALLELPAEFG